MSRSEIRFDDSTCDSAGGGWEGIRNRSQPRLRRERQEVAESGLVKKGEGE